MENTTFAGLTVLDADESVVEDGGKFIGHDRRTIDYFLERGAKTHRHTGAAGMVNPAVPLDAEIENSGGSIPGDLAMLIGYTLQDGARGETALAPPAVVSTPGPLDQPLVAPVADIEYDAGGVLTVDTYYYGLTYIDAAGGETPIGPSVAVSRQPGFASATIHLTGLNASIPVDAAGWRLYRMRSGGDFAFLASGTDADATYDDDGTQAAVCDDQPPSDNFNTTNSVNKLTLTLPDAGDLDDQAVFINVYVSDTGDFTGRCFLEQYPIASAGATVEFTEIVLEDDAPPEVSTAVGMPPKIDAASEIDWGSSGYPTGSGGGGGIAGIRVSDDNESYDETTEIIFANAEITSVGDGQVSVLASGGGGGGSGLDMFFDSNQIVYDGTAGAVPSDPSPLGLDLFTTIYGGPLSVGSDVDFGDAFTASVLTAALITDTMAWDGGQRAFATLRASDEPTGVILKGYDDGAGGLHALIATIDSVNGLRFGVLDGTDPVADFTLVAGGGGTYVDGDIYNLEVTANMGETLTGFLYAEVAINVTTGFGDPFDNNNVTEGMSGPILDDFGPDQEGGAGILADDDVNFAYVEAGRIVNSLTTPRLMLLSQAASNDADIGWHFTWDAETYASGPILTANYHYGGGGGGAERTGYNYTSGSLADDAREDGSLDTSSGIAASVLSILSITADHPCRVVLYSTAADQTADASRPFGTDPTGDHGVLLDAEIDIGGVLRINPATLLYSTDAGSTFYISVVNMSGSTETISVNFDAVAVVPL